MRRPNLTLSVKAKKRLLWVFVILAIVYVSIGGYIWRAMNQPPEAPKRTTKTKDAIRRATLA